MNHVIEYNNEKEGKNRLIEFWLKKLYIHIFIVSYNILYGPTGSGGRV